MKISKVKGRNLYRVYVKTESGYKKIYGETKKEVQSKAEALLYDLRRGNFSNPNTVLF